MYTAGSSAVVEKTSARSVCTPHFNLSQCSVMRIPFLQVMERFNVDIRFPKDKGSGVVVIQGLEENVEDAKEHLITLAEDYVRL